MDATSATCQLDHAFLSRGGELGRLIRDYDWSTTSLGPIDRWPEIVKTTIGLILRSPVPIVTLWGEKGVMVYNDGYARFAGARHPQLLGMDVLEAWPEAADWNRQVMETSFHRGEPLSVEDLQLTLYRHGRGEPVWMNLDYSPIPDEHGNPAGVIAIVVETTAKVRAEERSKGESERLERMFDQAPGFMGVLEGPEHRFAMANQAYFTLVGGRELLGMTVAEAIPETVGQGFITLLDDVFERKEAHVGLGTPVLLKNTEGAEQERFVDFIYQPLMQDGETWGIFVQGHDVTERKRFERHQQLLVGELNHRVKNNLAIVQSLAHQSFRSSVPPAEAIQRFEGRLEALAAAHSLLTRVNWEAATIREVAETALAPFCAADRRTIEGPEVRIPPQTAVSLALALHELATNAAKYGALSNDAGRVSVRWTRNDDQLELVWREENGPVVSPPTKRGFGTRMIERTLASDFGGTVDLQFPPEGVTCRVVSAIPVA